MLHDDIFKMIRNVQLIQNTHEFIVEEENKLLLSHLLSEQDKKKLLYI